MSKKNKLPRYVFGGQVYMLSSAGLDIYDVESRTYTLGNSEVTEDLAANAFRSYLDTRLRVARLNSEPLSAGDLPSLVDEFNESEEALVKIKAKVVPLQDYVSKDLLESIFTVCSELDRSMKCDQEQRSRNKYAELYELYGGVSPGKLPPIDTSEE